MKEVFSWSSWSRLMLIISLFFFTIAAMTAQTFTEAKASQGFSVESGIDNGITLDVDGITFDVLQTNKGSQFIIQESKKGTDYPFWIGEATEHTYKGRAVRVYPKSGKHFYLTVNAGKLKRKYLDKD